MGAEKLSDQPLGSSADSATQDLTFVSVSRDGQRATYIDDDGREYTIDIPRISFSSEAERTTNPTPVVPVTRSEPSALRPRELQQRIRGGASAEEVAEAAGTTVDKIWTFVGPILAERAHTAELAQGSSLRRRGSSTAALRTLGEAVAAHLDTLELQPEIVTWDSFRQYDGRWHVTGRYETASRSGSAAFTFDVNGNYVTSDNDDALWLVGEGVPDDLFAARVRRMTVVEEVIATTGEGSRGPSSLASTGAPERGDASQQDWLASPVEAYLETETIAIVETAPVIETDTPTALDQAETTVVGPEPEAAKPAKKKRTSIPSWDDIMFGGGR